MNERETLVKDELARQENFERERDELLVELDKPEFAEVRRLKAAEERMSAVQSRLRVLAESNSAAKGRFSRELATAAPDELRRLIQRARTELSVSRRVGHDDINDLNRVILLRSWLEGCEHALADPATSTRDLQGWVSRGTTLVDPAIELQVVR